MSGLFSDMDDDDFDTMADAAVDDVSVTKAGDAEPLTPRSTPDLFGHEAAEAQLLADFNAGRMPHAIILAGPAGIGKATLAYRLARFMLSQGADDGDSLFGAPPAPETLAVDAKHQVFSRVASGGHADLLVIERAFDDKKGKLKKNISAEDARSIAPFLRKTAAEGGWRVVIVDGAEDLNPTSQNALLKILEEPPSKALLILTTTQPGAFLPTIRSRCRMVHLKPLEDSVVEKLLLRSHPSLSIQEKSILLRVGAGSIGKAQQFYADDGITVYKSLLAVAQNMPQIDMVQVHDLADKLGRGSEDVFALVEEIMTGWCDHITRAAARGHAPIDILPGDSALFVVWQSSFPAGHFLQAGDKLRQLFGACVRFNLDKRQTIISAFMVLQNPDHQALAV